MYRREEEENTGVLYCWAASKMATASDRDAAMGLSTNTGLCALNNGKTCSRCSLPSFVSRCTASTLVRRYSIEETISTPREYISSVKPGIILRLEGISLLPCG